jgi:hypothetical protein
MKKLDETDNFLGDGRRILHQPVREAETYGIGKKKGYR